MKIFVGQAVTGEDINKIREESKQVCEAVEQSGHDSYCTLIEGDEFEEKKAGDKMNHAFSSLDGFDTFLAIIRSEKKSEGMLMEIGYSIAKGKKIILAINKEVKNTYLKEIANQIIEFENHEDLIKQLRELK